MAGAGGSEADSESRLGIYQKQEPWHRGQSQAADGHCAGLPGVSVSHLINKSHKAGPGLALVSSASFMQPSPFIGPQCHLILNWMQQSIKNVILAYPESAYTQILYAHREPTQAQDVPMMKAVQRQAAWLPSLSDRFTDSPEAEWLLKAAVIFGVLPKLLNTLFCTSGMNDSATCRHGLILPPCIVNSSIYIG
ncbi:unnamed protein product [Protopolystoma xenopodis]|uniref:Uncharacterized protein n=1 Tax=Protopolystoma xenopodis TaxID=117903 RepID=A0A3S5CUX8_9PLAT|nr:unnamed protein product [Protopolystoma xenopodis]